MASNTDSSLFEFTSSNTAPLSTNHDPSPPPTGHKLNGQNFLQWSQSVFWFICGRAKDGHLTGKITATPTTDPKFRSWKTDDHLVMSWLISSMTNEVGENFLLYKTAKEIWYAAKQTYSNSTNFSEMFALEARLYDLRQGDLSVTEYFHLLSRIWLQLDLFETYPWKCPDDITTYKSVVEQKRTIHFRLSLNKEVDAVRGRIMGTRPFPSTREAFAEVRHEESTKNLMMSESGNSGVSSALFTNHSNFNNLKGHV